MGGDTEKSNQTKEKYGRQYLTVNLSKAIKKGKPSRLACQEKIIYIYIYIYIYVYVCQFKEKYKC